jgi:hypothetical protein
VPGLSVLHITAIQLSSPIHDLNDFVGAFMNHQSFNFLEIRFSSSSQSASKGIDLFEKATAASQPLRHRGGYPIITMLDIIGISTLLSPLMLRSSCIAIISL